MRRCLTFLALFGAAVLAGAGIVVTASASPPLNAAKYAVKVHEFEGCECESVCPCIFRKDTTFGDCRGTMAFTVNGTYGSTALKEVTFSIASTRVGRNMEASTGKWRGIPYTSDKATAAEREAISGLTNVLMGDAYASLSRRTAPLRLTRSGDAHELRIGAVGRLRIHGIKSPAGKVMTIHYAPLSVGLPRNGLRHRGR